MFKIKTRYYLKLLTADPMKLTGRSKSKTVKDKTDENVFHLETTEIVLVHCNIVNNDYLQDSRILYTFFPNKSFFQLSEISPKNIFFIFLIF